MYAIRCIRVEVALPQEGERATLAFLFWPQTLACFFWDVSVFCVVSHKNLFFSGGKWVSRSKKTQFAPYQCFAFTFDVGGIGGGGVGLRRVLCVLWLWEAVVVVVELCQGILIKKTICKSCNVSWSNLVQFSKLAPKSSNLKICTQK